MEKEVFPKTIKIIREEQEKEASVWAQVKT